MAALPAKAVIAHLQRLAKGEAAHHEALERLLALAIAASL
jgi:hypothetical protein